MDANSNPTQILKGSLRNNAHKLLKQTGRTCEFPAGDYLFAKGDPGDWVLYIDAGVIEVSLIALDGKKSVLNHLEAGDILGEISVLDGKPRSADALAIEAVTGIKVPKYQILNYLRNDVDACFAIIEVLCERARNASDMFETRALTSANARLARCLLKFADNWGKTLSDGSLLISQPVSQTMLGEFSGLARENVNRHIKTWSDQGLLDFRKTGIIIYQPRQLRLLAEL